jgi:hypothetical protein
MPVLRFIEPCLPSLADRPPSGTNWIHEIKHDGYRLMARRDSVAPTIDGPGASETGEQEQMLSPGIIGTVGRPRQFASNMTHLAPVSAGLFLWGHRPDIFRDEIEGGRVVFLQPCCPNWPRFGGAFSWVNKTAPMIAGCVALWALAAFAVWPSAERTKRMALVHGRACGRAKSAGSHLLGHHTRMWRGPGVFA